MNKYIFILALVIGGWFLAKFVLDKKRPVNDDDMYYGFLKEIKKAFNNILIDVTDVPEIGNRILVKLNNIDDLVDISETARKPIYYIDNDKTCDFILLHDDEYCVYTLKATEDLVSVFDKYYVEYERKNKKENTKILEDLDKTTIIKIQDGSSFKVSPLKERDLRKAKEKEFLENMKDELLPKLKGR